MKTALELVAPYDDMHGLITPLLELVAKRAREEMRDAIANEMMAIAVDFKDSPYALAIVESALRVRAMKVTT